MSQLDELSEAVRNLSSQSRKEDLEEQENFREVSSKNENDMFDISKDLASYFANQKEDDTKTDEEVQEVVTETENVGKKVEDTNSLLHDSINIQNQLLSKMGEVNASIEKLITDFPVWLKEASLNSTGAGGLASLAEILGAGGIAGLVGSKGKKAVEAIEEGSTAEDTAKFVGEEAAADAVTKSPSVLGKTGTMIAGVTAGKTASGLASIFQKPSVFGRVGSALGSAARAIPFIGDAIQGITRGIESGSVGEGIAAAGGSLAGRLGGGLVGSIAGPIGTVGGEVAGSYYGSGLAADYYHKHFNNNPAQQNSPLGNLLGGFGMKGLNDLTGVTPNQQSNIPTPTNIPNTIQSQYHLNPSQYMKGGTFYSNVPESVMRSQGMYIPLNQHFVETGTGLIPGVGIRGPSSMLGGSVSPDNISSFLSGSGPGNVKQYDGPEGTSGHYGRNDGGDDYSGRAGDGKRIKSESFDKQAPGVIKKLMKDFNLSKEQAAAIVGNLGHESAGLQAGIQEKGQMSGRGGLGWAQWTGPRRRQFEEWAKENHMSTSDPEANYGFLKHELSTDYKKSIDELRKHKDVQSGTIAFEKSYEGARVKSYSSRLDYADKGLKDYNNSEKNSDGTEVASNIKGLPAGTPKEVTERLKSLKAQGLVTNDQCVSLANAAVGSKENVHDWRKGESADSGKLVVGTPIATFLNRRGEQTDRYAGGGSGTPGAHLDHAAVFENYLKDKEGHITGMHVAEQYAGSHGVREKDYMFGHGFGESNASNYNAVKTARGDYLGGERNPMSPHMEASQKPSTRITRPAPPAPPDHHRDNVQMASTKGDTTSSGGHYGGSDSRMSSRGQDKIRSASVGPSWGDVVRSITGSYGVT